LIFVVKYNVKTKHDNAVPRQDIGGKMTY